MRSVTEGGKSVPAEVEFVACNSRKCVRICEKCTFAPRGSFRLIWLALGNARLLTPAGNRNTAITDGQNAGLLSCIVCPVRIPFMQKPTSATPAGSVNVAGGADSQHVVELLKNTAAAHRLSRSSERASSGV